MKRLSVAALLAALPLAACWAQSPLVINELLYQPLSGGAEYVELYNLADTAVDLSNFHIARVLHDSLQTRYPLPAHVVAPHDYVVLTKDAAAVAAQWSGASLAKLVECRLPTYPNEGGSVVLCHADSSVADRLDYSPSMHSRLLRNRAGVALERRSPHRPTQEAGNWFSAASTSGYGTPTAPNSQSTEWLAEEAAFEFSSALLSPDGDGHDDRLTIAYRLEEGGLGLQAAVYNREGRRVKTLANNLLLGTHGELQWDGTTDGGQPAPAGRYVVVLTLYDLGSTRQQMKHTVSIVER